MLCGKVSLHLLQQKCVVHKPLAPVNDAGELPCRRPGTALSPPNTCRNTVRDLLSWLTEAGAVLTPTWLAESPGETSDPAPPTLTSLAGGEAIVFNMARSRKSKFSPRRDYRVSNVGSIEPKQLRNT